MRLTNQTKFIFIVDQSRPSELLRRCLQSIPLGTADRLVLWGQIVHDFFIEQSEGRFITTFLFFDSSFTFRVVVCFPTTRVLPTHTTNEDN